MDGGGADLIDTHVHYGTDAFANDLPEVMAGDMAEGVEKVLCLPISYEDNFVLSKRTECWADRIKYTVGIHPLHVPGFPTGDEQSFAADREIDLCRKKIDILEEFQEMMSSLQKLISSDPDRYAAVGETGIDTHTDAGRNNLYMQKISFREHIRLSQKNHLPLVLHLRGEDAFSQALSVMKKGRMANIHYRGVVHCFHGTREEMEMMLDGGRNDFVFGIGGMLTYPERGAVLRDTLRNSLPEEDILSKLVLETDSPYLVPQTKLESGTARNTAGCLTDVVPLIAELLGVPASEVIRRSDENARRMFGL